MNQTQMAFAYGAWQFSENAKMFIRDTGASPPLDLRSNLQNQRALMFALGLCTEKFLKQFWCFQNRLENQPAPLSDHQTENADWGGGGGGG